MSQPKLYLLDVEGTTSPISLVYEQLFPYARKHLRAFLREHAGEAEVAADLRLLAEESRAEAEEKQILRFAQDDKSLGRDERSMSAAEIEAAADYLLWLMDQDRKSTALKSLQGRILKAGFLAGELVGTMFPDVPEALMRWSRDAKVAIYSSGSVEAQQLLFRHSSAGDLTGYISAYFDTRVGAKTSPESYRVIAVAMGVETGELLFVSDVLRELDPAREAGCLTRLSVREGNAPVADVRGHTPVNTFRQLGSATGMSPTFLGAEFKAGFERVFTVTDYYDGPLKGVTFFRGEPHFYDRVWDEARNDYSNLFQLTPVPQDVFNLAIEDWEIWLRWESAFKSGRIGRNPHGVLPEDRVRYDEIRPVLDRALKTNGENCLIRAATFDNDPERPLTVRWEEARSN